MRWPRPYENVGIRANRYVLVLARRIATKRSGRWKMRVQKGGGGIEWWVMALGLGVVCALGV
jgi:hypothetical protein